MRTSDLAAHLRAIYERDGELTPEAVLDVARDPEHPLHGEFTWDDAAAAEGYRIQQALTLIRRVKITLVSATNPDVEVRVRRYVAPRDPARPHVYIDASDADPVARTHLLAQMRSEWAAFRRRWQSYNEFWNLIDEERERAAS